MPMSPNNAGTSSEHPATKIGIVDLDGILRGKMISAKKLAKASEGGIGFCNVVFGWDAADLPYENTAVSGWSTGYPDAYVTLDPSTRRSLPWENDTPFLLGDFSESELSDVCPRSLLKRIIAQYEELGMLPRTSFEYEWFNFRETPGSLRAKNGVDPSPITPGMFGYSLHRAGQENDYFRQLWDDLARFGIPLEGLHTETGDGVYEAAITYTTALASADRAALFKFAVKQIASRHGIMPSFMAKWNVELPGCSGHFHQSLWDAQSDKPLFFAAEADHRMHELMRHYVAGQLYCLPRILPLFAPTINSYKRLVPGSWASTTASWGVDNRTTALRVINPDANSMRLETRVPGADANPYLVSVAALAAGLYGIRKQLPLDTPLTTGNEYDNNDNPSLARSLEEATERMRAARDLSAELFGEGFTDHFIRTREWECAQYAAAVTDWELRRYFEVI